MLWRALGHIKSGFFIDVGAWAPDEDSVTKYFSDNGWNGINVEPHPFYFLKLEQGRPLDINLNVAVSDHTGTSVMHFIDDTGLSTIDEDFAREHVNAGRKSISKVVPLTTLREIWKSSVPKKQDVHFLKIDVEGLEKEVLLGNDWENNRPWIVVIEAMLPGVQVESHREWEKIIINSNYKHCYSDGLNRFYIAKEHADGLLEKFKYPPNIHDGFIHISSYDLKNEYFQLKEVNKKHIFDNVELSKDIENYSIEVAKLYQEIAKTEERMQTILSSTSWRIGMPFRKMAAHCPTGLRRHMRRILKLCWWLITPWRLPSRIRFILERKYARAPSWEHSSPIKSGQENTDLLVTEAFRIFKEREGKSYE